MRTTIDHVDTNATVLLHEQQITAANSSDLKGELVVLCRSGIDVLFIDMTEVTFCDSSGISALLLAHREMSNKGGYSILVGLSPEVEQLLQLARLDRVLFTYPTKEEALEDLARASDEGE